MRVVILGPGSIGGFLAAVLTKNNIPVMVVAQPKTAQAINERGITLASARFGVFTAQPAAVMALGDFHPEVLFVTTKAPALAGALASIPTTNLKSAVVIPLLNGFEHIALIRKAFGNRVAVGMIAGIEASRENATDIVSLDDHVHISLASDGDVLQEKLEAIAAMLNVCNIKTTVFPSEAEVIWNKLVRLSALAATTAASGLTLGEILNNAQWRATLEACVHEAAQLAECEGVQVNTEQTLKAIEQLAPTFSTSLAKDVNAGVQSEADALIGSLIRLAERHNIPCPTMERLFFLIQKRAAII